MNDRKIFIYLRQFTRNRINKDRPDWFDYEKVFVNLLKSIENKNCELTICFEFEGDWNNFYTKKYLPLNQIKFVDSKKCQNSFENANWSKSLSLTSEIIYNDILSGKISDNDLIYILEDDYLHVNNWVDIVLDLYNIYDFSNDYICLYDHFDKYLFRMSDEKILELGLEKHFGMYRNLQSQIIVSNFRHWRALPNCGLSMIFTKNLFLRDKEFWIGGYSDCEIGHQLLTKYKTNFWTPMPAASTHCIHPFVSPIINWEKVINAISITN